VTLIFLSYEVGGLLAGYAVSLTLATAVMFRYYAFGLSRPGLSHLRHLYEYAKYAWVTSLEGKSFAWLDTIVLGLFVTNSLIGIYEVAWSLASTLVLLNNSIQKSLFPELSELNEVEDFEMIREHIQEALTFSGITIFPGFVGAVVLGPELLKIYGSEFSAGATILLILIFARMSIAVGNTFYSTINALDRPDIGFRISIVLLVSNILLNLVLVRWIGWYGAAIATALTGLVNLGLSYRLLGRLIGGINIPTSEMGKQITASLVMGVVVWGLKTQLFDSHYVTFGLVMVGGVAYSAVLCGISARFRTKVVAVVTSF
jgi:O-antigen/teichoic acid export membrane protein